MARTNNTENERITTIGNGTDEPLRTTINELEGITEQTNETNTNTASTSSDNTAGTGKKRGRPAGSKNKPRTEKETIVLQEVEPPEKIKTGGVKTKTVNKQKFLTPEECKTWSTAIIETVNELAGAYIAPQAKLEPIEQQLISFSLPHYLETLEVSTVEKGQQILYPTALLLGVGLYGLRVGGLLLEQYRAKNKDSDRQFKEQTKDDIKNVQETPAYADDTIYSKNGEIPYGSSGNPYLAETQI